MHPALSADIWPAASRRRDLMAHLQPFGDDWPELLAHPAWPVAVQLLAQVEAEGAVAALAGGEPAFHNREHVGDVLDALLLLMREEPALGVEDKAVLLVAMIAHDFRHPGRPNRTLRELESAAYRAAQPALTGLSAREKRRVEHLILSTDPKGYDRLARPLVHGRTAQACAQMAVAADLLASVLPLRGFYLGHQLAQELGAAGDAKARGVGTLAGRAAFLAHCPPLGAAAHRLGLDRLVEVQLALIAALDPPLRHRSWSPAWGEAFAANVFNALGR